MHEESGISVEKLEAIWQSAVSHAKKANISNPEAYANAAIHHAAKNKAMDSARVIDDNGYLICPNSIITGNDVAQYYGAEIPGYQNLNLDPKRVYNVYRPIQEIQSQNFNGMPLLSKHVMDWDAGNQDKDYIIGTIHDSEVIENDQIKSTVIFWDAQAVDELDNGKKYLSAGYWYDPVLEAGNYRGQNYDIKMTNIRANHVAHVDNPRYKSAVVGDENTINQGVKTMTFKNKILQKLMERLQSKGLDSESMEKLEEEAKAADEEEKAEPDKKDEKGADGKGCDEEHEDEKEDKELIEKKLKEKGLDTDSVNRRIEAGIAAGVKAAVESMNSQRKAMDSAIDAYETLFGKSNRMAFDSADSVYDAILKAKGHDYKGKTIEQKQAMVEVITSSVQTRKIAADSSTVQSKSIFETNAALTKYLK